MALDWNLVGNVADSACKLIDGIPGVDAVAVTRCKDCKHRIYKYVDAEIGEIGGCELFNCVMSNDDFCSYGEPKEGNND